MHDTFVERIRRFYEADREELYAYAVSLAGSRATAEDVIHTVFYRLLERGHAPRDLRPYVFRCIRNAAIDEKRRTERGRAVADVFEAPVDSGNPGVGMDIEQAMAGLSDDERETIVMKVFTGLTFQEVAAVRRVSANTAASWYRRGLAKLRDFLEEDSSDEG